MIKLECTICGEKAKFKNLDEAIEAGWNIVKIKTGHKYVKIVACPKHSADDIFEIIEEKILGG